MSEVSQWKQFCSESNYDLCFFDWDVLKFFFGWMLERYAQQDMTSHVSALNDYFCQFPRYRDRSPVRAEHGPLTQL
eukprot:SAG11_NODE_1410_length_4997_cov_4.108616_1_plen_76_part_00